MFVLAVATNEFAKNTILVWYNYYFYQLTLGDKKRLQSKMIQLPLLPIEEFEKELTLIDNKYPFVIQYKAILACLVSGGFILITDTIVLLWLFVRHQKQLPTIVKSTPLISKLFGGNLTVLPELFKNQNATSMSASMPNLAPSSEITPTPKQFHTLQPKSAAPPLTGTHKSSNPELTKPHLLVQAAQELKSEGQLPWHCYKDYLMKHNIPSEQLTQELQDTVELARAHTLTSEKV